MSRLECLWFGCYPVETPAEPEDWSLALRSRTLISDEM